MDFNLDDPLGDLLSDGSNDSFFETAPKKKTSTPVKPQSAKSTTSATSLQTKGKFEDLFGIKTSTEAPKKVDIEINPSTPNQASKITELPKRTITAQKSQKSDSASNDDDIISDLGFDPKKPKKISKSNILDDLLGPIEPKKPMTTTRPFTTGGIQKEEPKVISRQSTETTESTVPGTYTASLPRPKTTGRRQSITSVNDPLGFFAGPTSSTKDVAKDFRETPKVKRKGTTADWLGLDLNSKSSQKEIPPPVSPAPLPYQNEHQTQMLTIPDPQTTFMVNQNASSSQGAILFAATTIETQNSLHTLQQQEAQITVATQVKGQEIALQEMQKRQQELLEQQESKFNELLQRQLARQSQLEMAIRSQQERINAHIQLLMTQTVPILPQTVPEAIKRETGDKSENTQNDLDEIQLKAEVKILELEKLRLEDLVSNINTNHEKEIEFMENSHRKQIRVLEDNIKSLETRLLAEIKSLEDFYTKKVEALESDRNNLSSSYEKKLKELQEEQVTVLKKLKTSHECDLDYLKEDYKKMIENVRQSKLLEFSAVQENASYLDTLRLASSHLENASEDLQTVKEEMYRRIDLVHKERELRLELREKKLEDAERRLKILEEASDQEKTRLIELVATLEMQLSKSTRDNAEEQWTMRQKMSSVEIERTSFEREKQFAREQITKDEKRIEELKQFQLEENQRLMQQIQDERQLLLTEKAKFDTTKKLQASSNQTQTAQVELDTALKVAQDATRQADQERERYFKIQRNLEAKKREMVDQENITRQKQDELQSTILSIKAKERRLEENMRNIRITEQGFNAKVQLLHSQMRQVAEREAQLSQDRLALSKERLELQELKRKLDQNKCSLCRIGERSTEISKLLVTENNQIEARPLTHAMNFEDNKIFHDKVDNFLDQEIYDSLKRMEVSNLNPNLAADLDDGIIYGAESFRVPNSLNVPTNLLDSEIMTLNFDIKKNFINE